PVHVVGYSMGARIALGLMVRHPELCVRATLVSGHPGLATPEARADREREDGRWAGLAERGIAAFVDAWEQHPVLASQRSLPPAVHEAQRRRRLRRSGPALASALRVLGLARMPDYGPALSSVSIPVDLVVGERDERFVAIAESMRQSLRRARLT